MIIQKWPVSMTPTPPPAAPRRRFRFGLRTLLVVVMLAAVASWLGFVLQADVASSGLWCLCL
jgi:hypothetical protein